MIDRVAASLGKPMVEVPVGFKWFVPGLIDGSFGFGGEESAGASFLRMDGTTWTTDKDGLILCLLASEILARTGSTPSELYARLVSEHGDPAYARVDAPADRQQKAKLGGALARRRHRDLAGGGGDHRQADRGPRQRGEDRWAQGDDRVGVVRRPSQRHGGRLQDLRRVVPRARAPRPGAGRGAARSSPLRWAEGRSSQDDDAGLWMTSRLRRTHKARPRVPVISVQGAVMSPSGPPEEPLGPGRLPTRSWTTRSRWQPAAGPGHCQGRGARRCLARERGPAPVARRRSDRVRHLHPRLRWRDRVMEHRRAALQGYSHDEALGLDFSMLFPPAEREAGRPRQLLDQARARGSHKHTGWLLKKDGSALWSEVVISSMLDDRGQNTGDVKVVRDLDRAAPARGRPELLLQRLQRTTSRCRSRPSRVSPSCSPTSTCWSRSASSSASSPTPPGS